MDGLQTEGSIPLANFLSAVHVKHLSTLTWTLELLCKKKEKRKRKTSSWQTGWSKTGLEGWEVIGHLFWLRSGTSLRTVTTDTDVNQLFWLCGRACLVISQWSLWWELQRRDKFNLPLHRASAGFYGSLLRYHPEQWRKTHTEGDWINGKYCSHYVYVCWHLVITQLKPESRVYFSLTQTAKLFIFHKCWRTERHGDKSQHINLSQQGT